MMNNGFGSPIDATDVIRKSVTRDDYNVAPTSGVYHWIIPNYTSGDRDLPMFWSYARDITLASTIYRESMWADAVSIAIAKIAARGFDVESDIPLRAKRAQDLFLNFDSGHGYVSGLQKHLQNFLLTGNGAHVEIVRATRSLGSRIIGLVPLDTFRCRRTGDPDYPIIYRDRRGAEHIMREWDVFSLADMPDPADTWYGLGHCAAERAYKSIMKLEAIERYILDKVSGQRILAFHIVGGVTPKNLEDAKLTAQGEATAKGVTNYMGAAIVAMMGDTPASLVTIPLAELPDGFNRKEEWDISMTTYARALGIAVQDLQPLSGQGLGTGTQSVVLDEAAKGQGLAVWSQQWEHAVNQYALDDKTTYAIKTHDIRDREREAKVSIDLAQVATLMLQVGLTPAQIINLLVDWNQLPPEYRVENIDLTPGDQLSDDEKPDQIEAGQVPTVAGVMPKLQPGTMPVGQTPTAKPVAGATPTPAVPGAPTNSKVPMAAGAANSQVAETADIQQVALNGAQVASALEILAKVSSQELTYEQGLNALQIFFGLTREQADQLLVEAGSGLVKVPAEPLPGEMGMNKLSAKELAETLKQATVTLSAYVIEQTQSDERAQRESELAQSDKARKEQVERETLDALKQLAKLAETPEPTPIVHTDPELRDAIKQLADSVTRQQAIINKLISAAAAPPPKVTPVVHTDPTLKSELQAGLAKLAELTQMQTKAMSAPRKLKITKRDANGRVLEWEEK